MQDVYKSIEKYNPKKKCKVLIVFDDMIADIQKTELLNRIVNKLFIKRKKIKNLSYFVSCNHILKHQKMLD